MKIINGIQLLEIVLTFLQNDFQNHSIQFSASVLSESDRGNYLAMNFFPAKP